MLAVPTADAGKIYRWTDEGGELIIADRPPQDSAIAYEIVELGNSRLRRTPENTSPPAAQSPRQPGAAQVTEPAPPARADAVPRDPRICQAARNNLEALTGLARVRMQGPDGEFYFLSEAEKEQEREQARTLIELHCD